MPDCDFVDVPARRLIPADHLRRAAQAPIGSDTERYHLDAAAAESLYRIADTLGQISRDLGRLAAKRADDA